MSAIITTANSSKALVVTRDLGQHHVKVTTADHRPYALSSLSRYSNQFFRYPSPKLDTIEFINILAKYVENNKHSVLIPTHSEDTYVLSKYKYKFDKFIKLPLHDYDIMKRMDNKASMALIAEELGIPAPKTILIQDLEVLNGTADKLEYPVVIKLRETSSSKGLSYINNKEDLISAYKQTIVKYDLTPDNYPIIQEYIPGEGYGVSMLLNNGDLRAKFSHRRIREYPITGGPSTCRISVEHHEMEKYAAKILEHFKWHGLAMVEFKLDSRSKKPVLMEVNPRIWGSINQAVRSGVHFPYLLYQMAVDGDVKPVLNYKLGVITRNYFDDSMSLIKTIGKSKNYSLCKEFVKYYDDDILSLQDPLPVINYVYTGIKSLKT